MNNCIIGFMLLRRRSDGKVESKHSYNSHNKKQKILDSWQSMYGNLSRFAIEETIDKIWELRRMKSESEPTVKKEKSPWKKKKDNEYGNIRGRGAWRGRRATDGGYIW